MAGGGVSSTAQKPKAPISGKPNFKTRAQMAAEAEAKIFTPSKETEDDTFLTGLMVGKRQGSEAGKRKLTQSAAKPIVDQEQQSEQDLEDELRDVVFDYENSKALVAMANNFLEEDKRPSFDPLQSEVQSNYSKTSTVTSKIKENIENVGKYDPYKIKLMQDRLNPNEKARLNEMLNEIDENLEEIMKEKAEYHK